MRVEKLEIWVHDHILKNDAIRHFCYGVYQRVLYLLSPKFKYEGEISVVTPDDGYEYLFGYYDKCPWSDDGRYLLALKVKNASTEADSTAPAEIVRIDLENNNACEVLAQTRCWNVQQGCMAQWMDDHTILYNDFRNGKYCAVILDLNSKAERLIDRPVYTVSSDRKTALTLDFARLHRLRPGYGYANTADETKGILCPEETCIWKIDLQSGEVTSLLSYGDLAGFEPRKEMEGAEHKVNHLMIAPGGKRFMVLHRWFQNQVKYTRLITCNMDGSELYNLSDDDFVSHCCWKNDTEIVSYLNKKDGGKGYYHLKDRTQTYERLWPQLAMDGHPTFSQDGSCVVTDTYPDRRRIQSLYVMKGKQIKRIARVFSPFKYGGDTRCDLHPRWSRDGKRICFDASFQGKRCVCFVEQTEKDWVLQYGEKASMRDPLISVVIPTHNRDYLLPRAVESAMRQTYPNVEIIVVSDGSEDNTDTIMEKYCSTSDRIRYISYHPAKGGNHARNIGIDEARGELIAFLDDDDEWHGDKLEKQYAVMAQDPRIGLVATGINSIQEGEKYVTKFIPSAEYDASAQILLKNCIGSTTTVMVRKDLIQSVGGFDENLGALQDYDCWVRLCQITRVGVVREPCVEYYNYKSSGQISGCTDKYESAVRYLENKYQHLTDTLSDAQRKERQVYFQLLLAKKAIRNGAPGLARKYVKAAAQIKVNKAVLACWGATFFSVGFVNRIKAILRGMKK